MEPRKQQKLKSNIWKLYLFQMLVGIDFSVPVIILFWIDNGLSLFQIMLLESIYAIAIVGMEIPTGYFSDRFGRKNSLIISGIALTIGVFCYMVGYNFYQFAIANIIWALGVSMFSGTDSAIVYDTLKELKQGKLYKKVFGNSYFYFFTAMSISCIVGGFVGDINLRWPFYLMLPFTILIIPLSFSLEEPGTHKLITGKNHLSRFFEIIKFSLIKNKKIKWLIIYSAVLFGFDLASWILYPPYFELTGITILHLGFLMASFSMVTALCSKYAYLIEGKLGKRYSLIMLVILNVVSFFLMANFIFIFSFSFAFIQQFVIGVSKPTITEYLNKGTKSEIRATVLSIQNMVGRLFYALIIPFIGWIADVYTLAQAFTMMGIMAFVTGGITLIILYKIKVI